MLCCRRPVYSPTLLQSICPHRFLKTKVELVCVAQEVKVYVFISLIHPLKKIHSRSLVSRSQTLAGRESLATRDYLYCLLPWALLSAGQYPAI